MHSRSPRLHSRVGMGIAFGERVTFLTLNKGWGDRRGPGQGAQPRDSRILACAGLKCLVSNTSGPRMPPPDERNGQRFIARHQDTVAECFRGFSHLGREDQVATYQWPDRAGFGRRPFGCENRPRLNMGRYDVDHQQAADRCELLGTDVNVSG